MGIGERVFGSAWFKAQVEKEVAKDKVPPSELFGQIIGVAAGVIIITFFTIHQTRPTGFFKEDFSNFDSIVMYLLIVLGMISPLVRFVFGRKNVARPFDAIGMAAFFVGGLYFLVKFPFDFSHFAEPLPRVLEPLLDWVSGTFARWLLGIGVVGSPFFSLYTFMIYEGVKKRLSESGAKGKM